MIHEYALEPELAATWTDLRDCQYFSEMFGSGKGRLVSRYPKKWRNLVWAFFAADSDVARKRMEALLDRLTRTTVRRRDYEWKTELPWMENTENEHKRQPFRAILARANPDGRRYILAAEDLDKSNDLWAVKTRLVVARNARTMAKAVAPMLRRCTTAVFIDPYFKPDDPGYQRSMGAFFWCLTGDQANPGGMDVQLHASDRIYRRGFAPRFLQQACEDYMAQNIPAGLRVRFLRWKEREGGETLHNRYILTDLGGVQFHHGLDEGREGETDDITLMDLDQYRQRQEQYTGDNPAFDPAEDPFEVVGTASPRPGWMDR